MGEEAKQEPPKAGSKPEEKAAEERKEEKQEEKPKEEKQEPKAPSPCVLFVDLHCMGCAKKIEKYIMKMKGVEGVVIDMSKNEVTIKGIVEPQGICNIITKKTKRRANVLSPLPAAEGEPVPEVVTSQVSAPIVVELNVNMHCEACAEQLKKKILQMRGVQTAVTEFSTGKVTVTGTMDSNKLVDYVYRRTRKQAKIVPQPEPEPEPEKKQEGDKEADEKPAEAAAEEAKPDQEKKEENEEEKKEEKEEEKKEEKEEEKKEEEKPAEEPKKEEGGEDKNDNKEEKEEEAKKEVADQNDEEGMKRMMMYYYQPLYVIERIPPPQLFSDENPNACCIS